MADNDRDEEIILLYQQGNQEALNILIRWYATPLYNFTARLTNRTDASDIVQESFIKAWKYIGRFDPKKASFKTWIFTIAKNTTTDFLRKKKTLSFSDMEKEGEEDSYLFSQNIADENPLPDAALQKLDDSRFLDNILEKISPTYREVLVLHYQEEMTFDEIGKILGKSLNTVKSQHRRALMELRTLAG